MSHEMSHEMSHTMKGMNSAFSINLSMNRNGSGTGWLPDAAPMNGYMFHTPKWMFMARYNHQDFSNRGSRGDKKQTHRIGSC